jgi:hypothetical protein
MSKASPAANVDLPTPPFPEIASFITLNITTTQRLSSRTLEFIFGNFVLFYHLVCTTIATNGIPAGLDCRILNKSQQDTTYNGDLPKNKEHDKRRRTRLLEETRRNTVESNGSRTKDCAKKNSMMPL